MMNFLMHHWKDLLDALAYLVFAASVLAKLTPSSLDDQLVGKLLLLLSLAKKKPL